MSWISIILRCVVGLFILLVFLLILLNVPAVQSYIANTAVQSITKDMDAAISIEKTSFDFNRGISIQGVELISPTGDTLGSINSLSVSPRGTILSLLSTRVSLNDMILDGIEINLTRSADAEDFNWSGVFASNSESTPEQSDTTTAGNSEFKLPLDLSRLRMSDVHITVDDQREGLKLSSYFVSLDVSLSQVDTEPNTLWIDQIVLDRPDIVYRSDPAIAEKDEDNNDSGGGVPLKILINQLSVLNGEIVYIEEGESGLKISALDLILANTTFENVRTWVAQVQDISLRYGSHEIKHLGIQDLKRNGPNLVADNFLMRTNQSLLEFDLAISNIENDFDFKNSISSVQLLPSFISPVEFFPFFPELARNVGSDPIGQSRIQLGGDYKISRRELEAIDMSLWVDGVHHFHGNALVHLSDVRGRSTVNAEIFELKSDLPALDLLSSLISLPDELKRMGEVSFNGSYEGYVNDFIANGRLITELGNLDMDVQINLSGEGEEAIAYQGQVQLDQFNMAGFMDNQDFGLINAHVDISNGQGPSLIDSKADISAVIQEITFKDYTYRDANYKGRLSSRIINGNFNIQDENVDFSFEGIVDVSDEVPLFDFNIVAQHIDFCALNLADFPCQVSLASDISFRGKDMSTMEGRGIIGDIRLQHDTSTLNIENIEILSSRIQRGMQLELKSDFVDFNIAGEFNLLSFVQQSFDQLLSNLQQHNTTWKIKKLKDSDLKQDFSFATYVKDASPLFRFLNQDIEESGRATITGALNTESGLMELDAFLPYVRYNDLIADTLELSIRSSGAESFVDVNFDRFTRGELQLLEGGLYSRFEGDSAHWEIRGANMEGDYIDLSGISRAEDQGYFTSIGEHSIQVDSADWHFLENKGFGIYPRRISMDNFILTDSNRSVTLNDQFDRHLQVTLDAFQLGFVNPIINYDKLDFGGTVDAQLIISDLFSNRSITGTVQVEDFTINGDEYGVLDLDAVRAENGNINVDLSIVKDTQRLLVNGLVGIDSSFVDAKIRLDDYPMRFFEYIIDDGISETEGTTDITAELFGPFNDLNIRGEGIIKNAGTKIDYLGAFYRIEDQKVGLTTEFIDLNNVVLIDEMGNEAIIEGGLTHNLFGDIQADLTISSPRFIALNTTEDDNPLYYGLGVGDITIDFNGPFDEIDIDVIATAGDLSQLFIPITTTEYGVDESFIKFNYAQEDEDTIQLSPLIEILRSEGADFEMNLTFTQDAEVSVIYDVNTSNVLKGRGEGDLRIRITREGDFTIHGEYNVVGGNYLYTAYGVIAKPFTILPGGTVRWTGDPINARLNVTAAYPGLRVPLTTFLAEYSDLPGFEVSNLNQRQDVDLTLLLGGNLYEPSIDFDIAFPNLTGPIKTLADSKLRTLKTSENAINNQVVGLMVFGDFLPDDNPLAQLSAGSIGQTAGNTVTQFITSQLSLMLSDYLTSQLSEDGFITGIDLEIALAQNTGVLNPTGVDNGIFQPDEVQVNLRNRIREGNVYLNVGGNYVRQGELGGAQNYVTGDFSLEWFLTDDKRLKLRFYSNFGYDEARTSGRQRYGLGINFRKEFGSIIDLDKLMEDLVEDVKSQSR